MKKNSKLSIAFVMAILLTTIGANAFAQKVDFSGKWKIDETKSNFGKNGSMAAAPEMTIIENNETFSIERGWSDKPLSYDGKISETVVEIKARRTKMTTRKSIKRSKDGQSIIITQIQTNDSPDAIVTWNTTEVWSLSADKKELTIKHTTGQKGGTKPEVLTFVYSKVE